MDNNTSNTGRVPPRWLLKIFTRINVWVYKVSKGRLMNSLAGMPIVLVQMTGARSGQIKTIPLMYVPYEKTIVLVASQGGSDKHPLWHYNLIKNPSVSITHNGKTLQLHARQASDAEKAIIWPTCVEYFPPYQAYQNRTKRNIPLFVCE
ncbi:MAG: nitroreductase family deazaflavin-dependent oxidoreductase [Pseudomonadales bacterium]|nr:nitroreductase family deazaflavin-dependent oxidoreductase [Pseudomonadales bacterium]